jgi:HPt (histidine-containing phosphotransfer) domain-containing protein
MGEDQANPPIIDVEGTLTRFGGDTGLFREMASILVEDAPRLAQQVEAAVLAEDASAIQMKAHALKGLVVGCGGVRAAQAAQKLEDAGRTQRLDDAAEQLADLQSDLKVFIETLRTYAQ